jgi:phage terminase large subunit GpA-like protein
MKLGSVTESLDKSLLSLAPPDDLSPSQYAEENLSIPIDGAIPGPIRFDNVPYQREPLDMISDPTCYQVSLMWGAQCGKTTVVNAGQAYFIDHDPQSQICMFPTEKDLEIWLETKFDPMVSANDHISKLMKTPRASGKRAIDNKVMKSYPGGYLFFAWSGSPNTMRSKSAPKIWTDEVDGYKKTKEGDPMKLIRKRSQTYGDRRLLFVTSTPTLKEASIIETAFQEGDQRRYYVTCPGCGLEQRLEFDQIKYKTDEEGELVRESVAYHCSGADCDQTFSDSLKKSLVRKGRWIASRKYRGHASYHLSELYSPFATFAQIIADYLQAVKDEDEQSFRNTSLAETWEIVGEEIDEDSLLSRMEPYKADVPTGGLVLTMGVDVQHDRLEWEVVAWGEGCENWSIDYQVVWGDTGLSEEDEDSPWFAMDEYLESVFQGEDGSLFKISTICVDSSDQTDRVYNYCRKRASRRVHAIKGVGGWGRPIVSAPTRQRTKRTRKPVDLFPVGTDVCKQDIQKRFKISRPGRGFCHIPNTREKEWFEQLTAEKLVKEKIKGRVQVYWKQTRKRNEALDCRQYATAALYILAQDPLRFLSRRAKTHARKIEKFEKTPEETISKPDKSIEQTKTKKVYKWR